MSIPIFVAVGGQRDNIGDTVLRRGLLDVLREAGELHVTVGNAPSTYVSGLGLQDSDVIYDDRASWRSASVTSMRRGRTAWAFHTGELTMSGPVLRSYLTLAPLIAGLRLSGGVGIHTGLGLRTATSQSLRDKLGAAAVGLAVRPCSVVTWRDQASARRARVGKVAPDWAFLPGSSSDSRNSEQRSLLTVSLRHDRPGPTDEYVDAVTRYAAATGLETVMVAQTERDLGPAREHAHRFHAQVAEWDTSDLAMAEDAVRAVYRRTAVALSNRLHGVVIAGTEGATPVGITMGSTEKLDRTLAAADVPSRGLDSIGRTSDEIYRHIVDTVDSSDSIITAFDDARSRLTTLSHSIIDTIAPGARRTHVRTGGGRS